MIDSHCHIDLPDFDNDRTEVINAALTAGIIRILVPGLGLEQVTTLPTLKLNYPMLDIAAGFHPYFLNEMTDRQWHRSLAQMSDWVSAHQSDIVAIGEFGLDATLALPMTFQRMVFVDQLELSKQFNKPVVLHHRKSHNEVIRLLKQQRFGQCGVIHAFSGSAQIAHTYIDMGFKLGIGGTITYPRGEKTRKALKDIPLEAMLLETDAPDMPLCGYQGMRNSPERLPLIAQQLAQLKQLSVEEVAEVTTMTYNSLFSSSPAL
jgi:TatD DNase family protein